MPWAATGSPCRSNGIGIPAMARETVFVVQSFIAGRGRSLKADQPVSCKSAEAARRMAERLAATKLGAVAFSMSGDAELGDFDDQPTILFRSGQLPASFDD
jgi:hypothetical protein